MSWYTATNEVRLASVQLCQACRSAHTVPLRVDGDVPTSLMATVDNLSNHEEGVSARVPRFRARRVTWSRPSLDVLSDPMDIFAGVEELYFGGTFNGRLDVRAWPSRLRKLEFGIKSRFNQPINDATWPTSLQELRFGSFNQPIEGVAWPTSLQQLTFGSCFNRPIEGVVLPSSLQ